MLGPGTSLSVRARLMAFTALMVVLLVVIGGLAAWNGERAASRVHVQANAVAPARTANLELASTFRSAERAFNTYVNLQRAGDGAQADEQLLAPWREASTSLRGDIDTVDHLTQQAPFDEPDVAGDVRGEVERMRFSMLTWIDATGEVAAARSGQGPPPVSTAAQLEQWSQLSTSASRDNATVQSTLDATNASIRQEIEGMLRAATVTMIVVTVLAVLVAVLVAWRTTRGLVQPLAMLRDTLRRQVAGERQAWANTEMGAAEIRSVSEDVNRLNKEHLRLVDQQAQSIALLRAGNDAVALLRQASGINEAAQVAVDSLGQTLGVDGVRLAGWTQETPFAAVWSRTSTARFQVPELWWHRLAQDIENHEPYRVVRVQDRGRHSDVDDMPDWIREDPVVAGSRSAMFLPIREAGGVLGIIAANCWSDDRPWDEAEIAYVERISRELARLATGRRDA